MPRKLHIGLLFLLVVGSVSFKSAAVAQTTTFSMGPTRTLWWVDRNGQEEPIQVPPAAYYFPELSPDGTKVVVTAEVSGNRDVYILDLTNGAAYRMTSYEGSDNQPIWSPDGKQIAYVSANATDLALNRGMAQILLQSLDGTGETRFLGSSLGEWIFPQSWVKDGKTILTIVADPSFQNFDVGMVSTEGNIPDRFLLKENYHEVQPQISPDGRWLAYCSNESGKNQIYVRPFPDIDSGKWQVSTDGGNSPRWSPDGKELYYVTGNESIEAFMAVEVNPEPMFSLGKPRTLFRGEYVGALPNNGIPYDVHPDGKRFLMMKER